MQMKKKESSIMFYDIWITNLQYSLTSPILCIRVYWRLYLDDMHCKVFSPWTDFVCSSPSVLFLFKEVFGALSVEKGEKYHIEECYLVGKPANRLPFRGQEKSRNNECLNVCCALSLSHCFKVTYCPQNQSCPLFARGGFKWQCYEK